MTKRERDYQSGLIKRIESLFPDCVVLKNDEQYRPGIPDLIILYGWHYVMLEVKRSSDEPFQPNQQYYLELFNNMGALAMCIYPENEDEVLREIQRSFET